MKKKKAMEQKELVLDFLKRGLKLNALVAHREFGMIGSTLAFSVFKLRKEGWDIQTRIRTSPVSGSRYAEYFLSPDWRLIEQEEKRKKFSKVFTVRSFRVGDVVQLHEREITGTINALYSAGFVCIRLDKENSYKASQDGSVDELWCLPSHVKKKIYKG